MPDVTLANSSGNTGNATPATPGSITATASNLLILVITAVGTNPTIATPATWTQIRKFQGSTRASAMYMLAGSSQAGGATNPSSTLGGTITGWCAIIGEFSQTGNNCGLQGSTSTTFSSQTQLTDSFSSQIGQTNSNTLFIYEVDRPTATLTAQNSGSAGLNSGEAASWTTTAISEAGNGCATDLFWFSNLAKGPGAWPVAKGLFGSGTNATAISAWFNTVASQPGYGVSALNNGNEGIMVGTYYQGMIGG
jgi:hypothetical protein